MVRRQLTLCLMLLLSGCATGAQIEGERIGDVAKDTTLRANNCESALLANPQFKSIAELLPPRDANLAPSMSLLANKQKPSPEDARVLVEYHDARQPCRREVMEGVGKIHPALVAVFAENFTFSDEAYLKLVQGELTYGQHARLNQEIRLRSRERFAQATASIQSELSNAHQFELERREAAGNALIAWSAYQQQIQAQQALVNAVNRPRMTQCRYVGVLLQCNTM